MSMETSGWRIIRSLCKSGGKNGVIIGHVPGAVFSFLNFEVVHFLKLLSLSSLHRLVCFKRSLTKPPYL